MPGPATSVQVRVGYILIGIITNDRVSQQNPLIHSLSSVWDLKPFCVTLIVLTLAFNFEIPSFSSASFIARVTACQHRRLQPSQCKREWKVSGPCRHHQSSRTCWHSQHRFQHSPRTTVVVVDPSLQMGESG